MRNHVIQASCEAGKEFLLMCPDLTHPWGMMGAKLAHTGLNEQHYQQKKGIGYG
jgi:hypothetical protein